MSKRLDQACQALGVGNEDLVDVCSSASRSSNSSRHTRETVMVVAHDQLIRSDVVLLPYDVTLDAAQTEFKGQSLMSGYCGETS